MSLNYPVLMKISGLISLILGVSMLPPLVVSYLYDGFDVAFSFGVLCMPLIITGLLILYFTQNMSRELKVREGYFAVTFCWLFTSFIGAFPFYLSGAIPSFIDAIFESTAAFTTTGCSVVRGFDLPMGIILWKAIMHWLGGLGIIIFAISILPALGINSLKLVSPEAYNPSLNRVKPKISESAKTLYAIYFGFTVMEFTLLSFTEMGAFEAVINTLGSISTSGITNGIPSIASYNSFYIEGIITLFTFLASVNFMLFYFFLNGKFKNVLQDVELRIFLVIILVSVTAVTLSLYTTGTYPTIGQAFRAGVFQSISFSTTSGYYIADYTLWPTFTQAILFSLMCIGGCSASACGSFKVIRFYTLLMLVLRGFRKRLHPRSIVAVRLGKSVISAETVSTITSFTMLYLVVYFLTALVLSFDNLDMTTTLTATGAILTNTGIAFGHLGPTNDYSMFSAPIRLFISFMMIVGRLEFFTVLILFTPHFWNVEKK